MRGLKQRNRADLRRKVRLNPSAGVSVALNEHGLRIGEGHPRARYTDHEVYLVLSLHDDGYGYKYIANKMEMPRSTVADIIRGKIRCQSADRWKTIK